MLCIFTISLFATEVFLDANSRVLAIHDAHQAYKPKPDDEGWSVLQYIIIFHPKPDKPTILLPKEEALLALYNE